MNKSDTYKKPLLVSDMVYGLIGFTVMTIYFGSLVYLLFWVDGHHHFDWLVSLETSGEAVVFSLKAGVTVTATTFLLAFFSSRKKMLE